MITNSVSLPSNRFTLSDGFRTCVNGKLYIGALGTDATVTANQIDVFYLNSSNTEVTLTQPIQLDAIGRPTDNNGNFASVYVKDNYSITIIDAYGVTQLTVTDLPIYTAGSFADLRNITPMYAGQSITLTGWNSGSTLGGGEFTAVMSNGTDDGVLTATSSKTAGYYWQRELNGPVTPYMAGCVGDGVTDDTVNFNAAINAACSTVTTSGSNLNYARSNFKGYDEDATKFKLNKFKITSQITIPHKLVNCDFSGTYIDFTEYTITGTSIDSPSYLLFFKNTEGANYGISHHILPYAVGLAGSSNNTYITCIGFDGGSYTSTGNRIILEQGNFNGGYCGLALSSHTYFLHVKDTTFNHQFVNYYVPPALSDYGEEITFERVKFTQSNLLHWLRGGSTWFINCSLDYPYSDSSNDYGWVKASNGEASYVDCWFEGYGPYGYVFNLPTGSVARIYVYGTTRFVLGAGNTKAKVLPFLINSDNCLLDIDGAMFKYASNIDTGYLTEDQRGLVAGTGNGFRIRNTKPIGIAVSFPSTIRPFSGINDTVIDRSFYSNTSTDLTSTGNAIWAWCNDASGKNSSLTRNTFGVTGGTISTLSKVSGSLHFSTGTTPSDSGSFYRAVLAVIPLKGNGNVTCKVKCNFSVSGIIGISWASFETLSDNTSTTAPKINNYVDQITYPVTTTGSTVTLPSLLQGSSASNGSYQEVKPDWATHAIIFVAIPKGVAGSVDVYDVYAREF